jgi:cytochrome c2
MKKAVLSLFVMLAVLVGTMAFSEQEKTIKPVIAITAGDKGDVTFPHEKHRKAIEDCMACHKLYPQKTDSINSEKKAGKIKDKQVMGTCLACHRSMKAENKKTGPTSCGDCHKK